MQIVPHIHDPQRTERIVSLMNAETGSSSRKMEFVRSVQVTQRLQRRNLNVKQGNAMKDPLLYMMEAATNVRNTKGLSVRSNVALVFAHPNKNCWKMVHVRTAQSILEVQLMEKNVQLMCVM